MRLKELHQVRAVVRELAVVGDGRHCGDPFHAFGGYPLLGVVTQHQPVSHIPFLAQKEAHVTAARYLLRFRGNAEAEDSLTAVLTQRHALLALDGGSQPEVREAELAAQPTLGVKVQQFGVTATASIQLEDIGGGIEEPPNLHQLSAFLVCVIDPVVHKDMPLLKTHVALLVLLQFSFQHLNRLLHIFLQGYLELTLHTDYLPVQANDYLLVESLAFHGGGELKLEIKDLVEGSSHDDVHEGLSVGDDVLQHHSHSHVHQVAGLVPALLQPREVNIELTLVTAVAHLAALELEAFILLQPGDFAQGVHDYLGRGDGVEGVAGAVQTPALLHCVQQVVAPAADGLAGREQHPQHPAQLLHVVKLEHLELLFEAVFSHNNIDKLLLTACTYR